MWKSINQLILNSGAVSLSHPGLIGMRACRPAWLTRAVWPQEAWRRAWLTTDTLWNRAGLRSGSRHSENCSVQTVVRESRSARSWKPFAFLSPFNCFLTLHRCECLLSHLQTPQVTLITSLIELGIVFISASEAKSLQRQSNGSTFRLNLIQFEQIRVHRFNLMPFDICFQTKPSFYSWSKLKCKNDMRYLFRRDTADCAEQDSNKPKKENVTLVYNFIPVVNARRCRLHLY